MRRRYTSEDVRIALRSVLAVLTARWVLRRGGFPAALEHYHLTRVGEQAHASQPVVRLHARTLRVAFRALRLPVVGSTCLPTSLALADVLRSRGLVPDVVIGVASEDGEFTAHAWVEVHGHRLDVSMIPPEVHGEIGRFRPSPPR